MESVAMNGEFGELFSKLRAEIEVLKAEAKMWRDEHKIQSVDNWAEIRDRLKKLDKLPCEKHIGLFNGFKIALALYGVAIGTVITVLIIHIVK